MSKANLLKLNEKRKREEGLMYLREVIVANRAIKEWMVKNTNYSVLIQGGVYFLFKESIDSSGWFIALFLILGIWIVSIYILNSNRGSIEKLRQKERDLIKNIPFETIENYWAGGNKDLEKDYRYFIIYGSFIMVTGIVLLLNLARINNGLRKFICDLICIS